MSEQFGGIQVLEQNQPWRKVCPVPTLPLQFRSWRLLPRIKDVEGVEDARGIFE